MKVDRAQKFCDKINNFTVQIAKLRNYEFGFQRCFSSSAPMAYQEVLDNLSSRSYQPLVDSLGAAGA